MKYLVNYSQTNDLQIEVEAKDKDEARLNADQKLIDKTFDELLNESKRGCWEFTYTDEEE